MKPFLQEAESLKTLLSVARGDAPADLVLTGGQLVNVFTGEIYPAEVAIVGERFAGVSTTPGTYRGKQTIDLAGEYIAPGFMDAHVHIESSMLLPAEYANAVLPHGTTAVVTDPHEIANVYGLDGIRFMLQASEGLPIHVFVMLSSCVPATDMETSGARLGVEDLATLRNEERVLGIAEMMNYPGVANGSDDMVSKALLGHGERKRVDGHAPLVGGTMLQAYAAAGVASDHESVSAEEALQKMRAGMQVLIREGSTARNLDALLPLITTENSRFCSWATDDKQPDDLETQGHIDHNIRQAIKQGLDPVTAIQMATINTARHFGLNDMGAVAPGYLADLVTFANLQNIQVSRTFASGRLVAEAGHVIAPLANKVAPPARGMMPAQLTEASFRIPAAGRRARVIVALPDQIVTQDCIAEVKVEDGWALADTGRDILKLAVVERHIGTGNVGLGFVQGFHLNAGALASSVAHDSHNVVVVGTNDSDMLLAAQTVIEMGGGLSAARDGEVLARLALPVAGLMSDQPLGPVRDALLVLLQRARELGCPLSNPYMAMAFLALPVIPALKLTDKGLVDVHKFSLVPLFVS
ncbi:MAG: adenine deaminase [Chloroflexia bacterium]|jgi:adenine deaminase|nr:adenine deaminase [Chloroflexia bacterium]